MTTHMTRAWKRTFHETTALPSLSAALQWHPAHAPLGPTDLPPPCYYEFIEWSSCVEREGGAHCADSFRRLHDCVNRRHRD